MKSEQIKCFSGSGYVLCVNKKSKKELTLSLECRVPCYRDMNKLAELSTQSPWGDYKKGIELIIEWTLTHHISMLFAN